MSAARYRVIQISARDGAFVRELPVTGIVYAETLNGDGSASVGIPLTCPEADPESLIPGISGLIIERNGVPAWGGIVWTMAADLAAGTLTLNAAGFHSYYKGRVLHDGYTRRGDQTALIKDWINACNADNGVGTDVSALANTGRERFRTWTQFELKNVAEAIQELAEDDGGFNFRYVPYTGGGFHGHRLVMSPRGGAVIPSALVHGTNCDVTQVSYDSASMATRAYAVGADNGNGTKLVGITDNLDLATRMATKHVVASFSDVKHTETLLNKSAAIISAGREPVAIPALTLYPNVFDPTTFIPGDSGPVQVDCGYVALLDDFVITERRTSVDANGTEITTLALANKELFTSAD
ncbi:hypothetical protein [Streptomyces sp. NPDC059874]|uniref:hypothetical protein n=1 Tax=Streptomyces sp. NPDC059874 TaxID=3346983 RepID=UPI003669242C